MNFAIEFQNSSNARMFTGDTSRPAPHGTNMPVKARSWPWLEPFSVRKSFKLIWMFPLGESRAPSLVSSGATFQKPGGFELDQLIPTAMGHAPTVLGTSMPVTARSLTTQPVRFVLSGSVNSRQYPHFAWQNHTTCFREMPPLACIDLQKAKGVISSLRKVQ